VGLSLTRQLTAGEAALSFILRHLPIKYGKHRLLGRACPKAWVKEDPVVAIGFHGKRLTLDISDLVGWHFAMLRKYQPEIVDILLQFSDKNAEEVFWDIGANNGAILCQMANKLSKAKFVAIEPQPELVKQLIHNTASDDRCQVFQVALGNEEKIASLYIPDGNYGAASFVRKHAQAKFVSVKIETAETIKVRSGLGWPTLVKIDVEGYEPHVIRSLQPAFESRSIKCCIFENKQYNDYDQEDHLRDIRSTVAQFGYKTYAIRKTAFSIWLEETSEIVTRATDYVLARGAGARPE
jgi:FkbM family methyltransferase